jgi:hypothetical protein
MQLLREKTRNRNGLPTPTLYHQGRTLRSLQRNLSPLMPVSLFLTPFPFSSPPAARASSRKSGALRHIVDRPSARLPSR